MHIKQMNYLQLHNIKNTVCETFTFESIFTFKSGLWVIQVRWK